MKQSIYKHYNKEVLQQACFEFRINIGEAKLIRDNKNLVYDCGDRILRLSHSDFRKRIDIEAELDWLIFLNNNDLPVVEVIQTNSNSDLIQIGWAKDYFTIVCFDKIKGNKITKKDWNNKHFNRLGEITGRLHKIGNQYENKNGLRYKDWDKITEFGFYKYLPQDKRELIKLYQRLVSQIKELPKTDENYGLIHYDIHHGNYLLTEHDSKLVLFDFEMTCNSWFINDIATILYYANHFPNLMNEADFSTRFMENFWKGYEKENRIKEEEKKWISIFLLYRDLMVFGLLSKIWKDKKLAKNEKRYLEMVESSIERRRKRS